MEIRKGRGFFLEIFFRGERSARRGLKVFEVSKFFCSDNFLGFFFLIYDDRFCISGQTNNGI